MATPIHTRLTGDIWDWNIDDLLAPMTEISRLGGSGPFVINLSTASTPIEATSKSLPGIEKVQVYQIQRIEDRRPRYRLRLGPFASEDDADAALIKAREIFPGALTATAAEDDLQAIGLLQSRSNTVVARLVRQTAPIAAAAPNPPQGAQPVRAPQAFAKPLPGPAPKPTPAAAVRAPTPAQTPTVARANPPPPLPGRAAHAPIAPARQNLEGTQTLRPLTPLELAADDKSQWYVIQLSTANQAFDPDTLPNLDIFSVYRLYSVAGMEQERVVHALRLGFFGAEIAARAVMSYVAAYYDKATITRVSVAERERFATQCLEARKDVGATGRHAVIEITDERVVRARRTASANDLRGEPTVSTSP